MKNVKSIVGYNLLVLVIYSLVIHITIHGQERELSVLLLSALAVVVHTGLNLIVAIAYFIKRDAELGKSFLLSTFTVLLIGFSVCLGSVAL